MASPGRKVAPGKETLHKSNSDPVRRIHRQYVKGRGSGSTPVSRCFLNLDGYSYVIVASPPEKKKDSSDDPSVPPPPTSKNGQLSKQGSLTILRRSSSRTLSGRGARHSSDGDPADNVDLLQDALPAVDTPESCEKAALRLRALLRHLQEGEVAVGVLQKNLQFAADVLDTLYVEETNRSEATKDRAITISLGPPTKKGRRPPLSAVALASRRHVGDEEDELSEVEPDAVPQEVREWLASTFTRQLNTSRRKTDEKPRFRSVANAIRAGIFVERIYRRLSSATFLQLPPEVTRILKSVDEWNFDVWKLQEASANTPLRCLAYELLNRYGLLHKFKMPPATLETFLTQVESGYCKYKNPYHNNVHAADVLQTMHYMLSQTGLMNWLNDVEILATLMAALVHDYEHTGTTNNFHVMSGSETAILYNDRAVLENHHICAAFRLLRAEEHNVLVNLSREEYREFRTLVIEMVLATDMSSHFQQIKAMKTMLALQDTSLDKAKSLSLVLHCCDISHPSKNWALHERWTTQLLEEFFRQGDKERELGLPYSPLCDRNNTLVAESQIGFIDFIVDPSLGVCGDLLDKVAALSVPPSTPTIAEEPHNEPGGPIKRPVRPGGVVGVEVRRPWQDCLAANKARWKERAMKDAEIRAEMALRNEKVNGESGEGEEDAPEDTIEEEEGEGGKGEASNEENGE
ncbi:dual specificity calcium/calmodulin-dependent 3',5'-cyclic nucleotide phosphodiesterase 1A-like isoform X1 [Eriocheir sinensis]|uniref:dual specificity calcium/calmodulin-dependent 3',5'-cyclic nucleotide phosphodiesterase 1A-like isoform X1 n=1 Tax=Eriocheir sinensis TaxID=95602 RepID=UPI0021C60D28|nr:dual specificity calcium/calmodulin-dependent 3',5'-cyclic nucleotide phosphodiesterase 1A-like isoform X1 [Eriocheir sinensis]XP_050714057.1 dual specificity calcium/calmodulin-dependent 3',5'-cyclic nucleotide phosphodiesterase 1A-like isoform X1 [Eriocheir sinensis]XP_050714058.1 dual specificity calcium/calmodulin-dependent 3',5'-cyclic nucleotide phosphodiesterase 1A-like isoform X1 [Eriocheir sinensis]